MAPQTEVDVDIEIAGRMLTTLPEDDGQLYRTGPGRRQDTGRRAADLGVVGALGEPGRFRCNGPIWHRPATRVQERHQLRPVGFDSGRLADGSITRPRLPGRLSSLTHATWAPGPGVPAWGHVGEAREAVRL